MALLDRYLSAVGRHLPAEKLEDILSELRDDIQARLDERAGQLGRPLTTDDEAEVLRPYGRPLLMAARYAKQQQLIGPGWFPFYWMTLKVALAVVLAIQVALVALFIVMGRPTGEALGRLFQFPFGTAVHVFGWVTLVFGGLELFTTRASFAEKWDPRKLPPPTPVGLPPASRVETGIELVVSAVFATWWVALHDSSGMLHLPSAVLLSPAWSAFYLPILFLILASLLSKCVTLVRPDWSGFRVASGALCTAAGVAIAVWLLSSGPMFLPARAGHDAETLARILNSGMWWGIGVGVAIAIATTGWELWRWLRGRRSRQAIG
jgi:hypothetical protein